MRERFREAGADALSDYELMELVLFRALPRRDVKPLAKDLIAKFGSFAEVISAPEKRLREVKGLGDAAVIDLLIGAGADLNRTDYTGRTALAWADYQSKRFVSDRLRKAGAKEQ